MKYILWIPLAFKFVVVTNFTVCAILKVEGGDTESFGVVFYSEYSNFLEGKDCKFILLFYDKFGIISQYPNFANKTWPSSIKRIQISSTTVMFG